MKYTLALALGMAVLSFTWFVRAEATRVLVISGGELNGISAHLSAELRSLGFEVVDSTGAIRETRGEALEAAARQAKAVAALRMRVSPGGVEVWAMDRLTQKTVLREMVVDEGGDDALVALRAVELLRATLLEVQAPHLVPAVGVPSPHSEAPVPRPAPQRSPATSLEIGPALSFSPEGLSVAAHVRACLRWLGASRLNLGLTVIAPTLPAVVHEAEGRAKVTLSTAALGGDYLLLPRSSVYGARVSLGTGVLWAHLQGSAAPGYGSRSDNVFTSLTFVSIAGSRALGRVARLWIDATLALAAPRFVVRFADRDVATWGRPAVFGALGVEFPLL